MNDDYEIINSSLERKITMKDITVEIFIYRGAQDSVWILEVQDQGGGSTVWDDRFPTEQAALDEAMRTIETDGNESFAQPAK